MILITERRVSGCSWGQRSAAAYYSHCSLNDPAGLLRISKLSEQLPDRNLRVDFCLPRVGLNGKRKLNFSLKFNYLTWSCSLLPAFHTTEPFLSSFILFFFRGLDPRAASLYLATPGEQSRPWPYLWKAHFPRGNLPASTLGSALKWWTSETLCLLGANQRGRAWLLLPSGLTSLPASLTQLFFPSHSPRLARTPSLHRATA